MFYVYKMEYKGGKVSSTLQLPKYSEDIFAEYKNVYNECFYNMRKSLGVKPFDFLSSAEKLKEKADNIYILYDKKLIGSVAIYGNEIDDLIVNKKYQGLGYGKKLLLFAVSMMQDAGIDPIQLHVAKWNSNAVRLYENTGFECVKIKEIII